MFGGPTKDGLRYSKGIAFRRVAGIVVLILLGAALVAGGIVLATLALRP